MTNKIFLGNSVFYYAAVLFISLVILQSCENAAATTYVESRMNQDMMQTLRHPDSVAIFYVTSDRVSPNYKAVSEKFQLESQSIKSLQTLLLNDRHFTHGMAKLSVFLPEIAFTFQKEKTKVDVVFSPTSNQLKIYMGDAAVLMDYEPAREAFGDFLHSFNKINKE